MRSMIRASAWNVCRSKYHAPVAATHIAPVRKDASSMCGNRTHGDLHPTVVDHDPERRERGFPRDHRRGNKIEPRRDTLAAEHQDAEEASLERECGEGFVGEERPLDRQGD